MLNFENKAEVNTADNAVESRISLADRLESITGPVGAAARSSAETATNAGKESNSAAEALRSKSSSALDGLLPGFDIGFAQKHADKEIPANPKSIADDIATHHGQLTPEALDALRAIASKPVEMYPSDAPPPTDFHEVEKMVNAELLKQHSPYQLNLDIGRPGSDFRSKHPEPPHEGYRIGNWSSFGLHASVEDGKTGKTLGNDNVLYSWESYCNF